MKEIAKILEELRAHPEARDLMNAKADAKGTEDEARLYGEIASRLGYEAGTQEFLDYISGTGEADQSRRTFMRSLSCSGTLPLSLDSR